MSAQTETQETEAQSDGPLLDLTDAGVKKFIKQAKARGYVTMEDLNKVLRDHRNNKIAEMDPQLLLLLDEVNGKLGNGKELHIISGYRSPESNAKLHANSNGVAKRSMHMDGKAIDIRLPGKDLKTLHKAAMSLKGGGVGYYPDSQFVHMDTGRVRYW